MSKTSVSGSHSEIFQIDNVIRDVMAWQFQIFHKLINTNIYGDIALPSKGIFIQQGRSEKRIHLQHSPTSWHESQNANNNVQHCHMRKSNQNDKNRDKSEEYHSLDQSEDKLKICTEFTPPNRYCLRQGKQKTELCQTMERCIHFLGKKTNKTTL